MLPRIQRPGIISSVLELNVVTVEGNGVVKISRLQDCQNEVKVLGVA
jgi:hypothetical protein